MRLNLRAAIIAEHVSGKPFSELSIYDDSDCVHLLYAMCRAGGSVDTLADFRGLMETDSVFVTRTTTRAAELFQTLSEDGGAGTDKPGAEGGGLPMRQIAAMLTVRGGLDASYVLNEMPLTDVPMYSEAIANQEKQSVEWSRYFAFTAVSPWVEKGSSMERVVPLPWDNTPDQSDNITGEEAARIIESLQRNGIDGKA